MERVAAGLVRALCFFTAVEFPPSQVELVAAWDAGPEGEGCSQHEAFSALKHLIDNGSIREINARLVFPGQEQLIQRHAQREVWFPRKWRLAKRVTRLLAWLPGVRFVALCNTMAWMDASDHADMDFFIVTKAGMIWQTRAACILPARLFGTRPSERHGERDALCFSFFIDEQALDLTASQLEDDPYFRHWFISLLPCLDDGIGQRLWSANESWSKRHPLALRWATATNIRRHSWTLPKRITDFLEKIVRWGQERFFAPLIREQMNKDTRVIVTDHILKFHTEDGRESYRQKYREYCKKYGIES